MLTWLEIDSRALQYNLRQYKKIIGKKVALMPVIKSNAYGHGFLSVAKICETNSEVEALCVVSLDEALELIKNNISKKPIHILSFFEHDFKKVSTAATHNIIFPIHDIESARFLHSVGERIRKTITAHLKIDTGASRIGILPKDALSIFKKIKKEYTSIHLTGIYSHFASSKESPQKTKKQFLLLQSTNNTLKEHGFDYLPQHIACSAAISQYKFTHADAVRLGLGLYGLHAEKKTKNLALKPALSWYTTVIQTKNLPAGTSIGYGETYTTKHPTTIAILPVGYYDGFDRRLSNRGYVIIRNKKYPIRGRICMNMCMVEITNSSIKTGDTVTLIGGSKNLSVSADQIAAWCNTINYEICARINPLLPRVII